MNKIKAKALVRAAIDMIETIDSETSARKFMSKKLEMEVYNYLCEAWKFLEENGVVTE